MLTNIKIENFKKLESVSFPVSSSVVIIGPNNSGKSTIFQALCLWEIGVRNYIAAKEQGKLDANEQVILNRKDLLNSPISDVRFLWPEQKTHLTSTEKNQQNIILSVELTGENKGEIWNCRAEFYYYNAESFSCEIKTGLNEIKKLYDEGNGLHFGFLQAMSGISTSEDKLTQGSIKRKLGEGKTAEVLRNICYEILYPEIASKDISKIDCTWRRLCETVEPMFGVKLEQPEYVKSTGLIHFEYSENGIKYDVASGGRGFQQTLLLFSYMFANPGTVLLLDEPDAHLEVIRQRDTFRKINEIAAETDSQIIIASHSEVVLNEAAETSSVIALVENRAIPLNVSTKSQSIRYIKKALTEISWEKYYLARIKGHVFYLEGATDLQMLLHFANKLQHKAESFLRVANVQYTSDNVPGTAINNFASLQAIFNELRGLALFDNIPNLQENPRLKIVCWRKREMENYFARPELLLKYAKLLQFKYPKFTQRQLEETMQQTVSDYTLPVYLKNPDDEWWDNAKLSDEWLDKIFPEFYRQSGIPQDFYKRDYYQLISLMDKQDISDEISEKLDLIYDTLNIY
ncbi:MAG: ATP-binding protein [Prevotellaceae bacterium]|jgi:predicted ATPase|nr:ATP-binding protein [Prevotellaceae bacterium]